MDRRRFLGQIAGTGAMIMPCGPAFAQGNGGTIRIIFPFSPGGPGDALSRLVGEAIGSALGRTVIVENRTGADGRIGIQAAKAARPDGDTLLVTTGPTLWLMHMVHTAPGFDPARDFEPIVQIGDYDFCVAVANNTSIMSLSEFMTWVKANPQRATYGVPASGTFPHFLGLQLSKIFGVDMHRVVYRGGVPVINDLINGQIPIGIGTSADALQQYRAGNLRVLATTGVQRSPFTPEVPTLRESGIDLIGDAWYGLWAPAGTPRTLVMQLNDIVNAMLTRPGMRDRLALVGVTPAGGPPERLATGMADAAAQWAPVVKASGYTIDQ